MAERKIVTRKWDPANYIETAEDVIAVLEVALEDGDPQEFAEALGDIARSQGMSEIAKKAGMSRESLYKALSDKGNPQWATIVNVLKAMNYRLRVEPIPAPEAA